MSAIGETTCELRVSDDKISLLLDCSDPHQDLTTTVARIEAGFHELELVEFPDPDELSKILKKACLPGEFLTAFPIIVGWQPTAGQDGRLEWARDYFNEEQVQDNEKEALDFWEHDDQQAVNKDELLATVYRPVPGEPGLNVFCQEIPVGKPGAVKLRSGKGVRQVDEGQYIAYYADFAGRIRYQDDTVVVDDVYVIKGDVSLETGNIRHTGTVHVEGDVKTGATIQADGDIIVKGMLDPCHIQCGGSLTVVGGIVGLPEYLIEVADDVKAMYISGAVLHSGGTVTVSNEIANADIKAFDKVMVPTGRIAGGTILARNEIQVAEAGGSGATVTMLVVGVDFTIDRKVAEREAKIDKLEEAQEKIGDALTKAATAVGVERESDHPLLIELSGKSKQIGEAIIREYTAIKADKSDTISPYCQVLMLREVWSGTTIRIKDIKTVIRSSIEKPRVARLSQGKVSILPLGEGNMPKG